MKYAFAILVSIVFQSIMSIVEALSPLKIQSILTDASYDSKAFPPYNIVNGTDYWKTIEICCNKEIEIIIELNHEKYFIH